MDITGGASRRLSWKRIQYLTSELEEAVSLKTIGITKRLIEISFLSSTNAVQTGNLEAKPYRGKRNSLKES